MAATRILVLMRHAEAASPGAGGDSKRPLTSKGRDDAASMGRRLAEIAVPACILASSSVRTRETAALVAQQAGRSAPPVQFEERLYLADRSTILSVISGLPASLTALVVVGHNPGISEALGALSDRPVQGMAPAAFAVMRFAAETWQDAMQTEGVLEHFAQP